jgi:predicted RecA/RadA family phage recombinase
MQNFVQEGKVLTLVAPYDVAAGQGALIDQFFGVAQNDYKGDAAGEFRIEGVFDLVKASGEVWAQGDTIYWDDTIKACTTSATHSTDDTPPVVTNNLSIGSAILGAVSLSVVGRVYLPGKTG